MELDATTNVGSRSNYANRDANSITISLIVPCYNVAAEIPTFLRSLDAQDCDPEELEIIFVIDGSPDDSEKIIEEWMTTSRFRVLMLVQDNRGVSGALNTGIDFANGAWLGFAGPDDRLSISFFSEVLTSIRSNQAVDLFVTPLVRVASDGTIRGHPLDFKFTGKAGDALVDLLENPQMVHLHSGGTFLRRSRVLAENLRFDERLRKGFEDAHLIGRYLLTLERPRYLIVSRAYYHYVIREESITAQTDYSKYIEICKVAYFDLLQRSSPAPQWVGNLILYDLWWLFRQHLQMRSRVFSLTEAQQSELNDLTRKALTEIGLQTIRLFRVVNVPLDVRSAWENAAVAGGESHVAVLREYDPFRRLQKIAFHSSDTHATAAVFLNGRPLRVAFQKVRSIPIFGRPWIYEHIYWVDVFNIESQVENIELQATSAGLSFIFDGKALTPRKAGQLLQKVPAARPKLTLGRSASKSEPSRITTRLQKTLETWQEKRSRFLFAVSYRFGGLMNWRRRFSNAWVLIDRDLQANDNAEALYRYIRSNRPDLNVWFVLNRKSADFRRLQSDGFRIVSHGSMMHFCLMKEARVLASSMADHYILHPFPRRFLAKTWSFVFLQHGVTQGSIHRWLNPKEIDLLLTSTQAEHDSIVNSPGPYKFSAREVTLSGMPRHDRLFSLLSRHTPTKSKQCLLIMPTWRNYLMGSSTGGRREALAEFNESHFVRAWSSFLNGDMLKEVISQPQTEVVMLPHPGIDEHWNDLRLPPGMRRASYLGDDVQKLLASATHVVTDYSSQAFEGAFCDAPTTYFQFDRREFFSGDHISSLGYFDYHQHGFGPVCEDIEALERNLELMLNETHPQLAEYRRRIEGLYPLKDGKASERAVLEIEKRLKPDASLHHGESALNE